MDKWLSHPTALKILSVIIAILLWAVVHFDPESPNTVASLTETKVIEAVKVKTVGLDEKEQFLRLIEPSVIRIVVRGTRSELLAATPDDYVVSVDLSGLGDGVHDLPLRVSLPGGLQLMEKSPARVKVELVPMQTKEFDVTIHTKGTPANGYKIGVPIVKPGKRVFVTLPKDEMDEVGTVGAVIDVDGKEETVRDKKVKVMVYDKEGMEIKDADIDPNVVEVEVPITKPFKKVPLQIGFTGKLQEGLSIESFTPDTNEVTVYGPQKEIDQLEFFDDIVVNLAAIKESGTITLELKPPDNLASIDPEKINVNIKVAPSETRVLPQIPITIGGLTDGLEVKFVTPGEGTIDLPVTGAPAILAKLNAKDVQAIADLTGLMPGQHSIRLDVRLPQFTELGLTAEPVVVVDVIDKTAAPIPGDAGTGADTADGSSAADGSADTDTLPADHADQQQQTTGSADNTATNTADASGGGSGSGITEP